LTVAASPRPPTFAGPSTAATSVREMDAEAPMCEDSTLLEEIPRVKSDRRQVALKALAGLAAASLLVMAAVVMLKPTAAVSEPTAQMEVETIGLYSNAKTCHACMGGTCQCDAMRCGGIELEESCCQKCCCASYGGYLTSDHFDGSFDCNAALANWRHEWSTAKQDWCCGHAGLGCMSWWARNKTWVTIAIVVVLLCGLVGFAWYRKNQKKKEVEAAAAAAKKKEEEEEANEKKKKDDESQGWLTCASPGH